MLVVISPWSCFTLSLHSPDLFFQSVALLLVDQLTWPSCQGWFTQFLFAMILISSLGGQMIAKHLPSELSSTVANLVKTVYWTQNVKLAERILDANLSAIAKLRSFSAKLFPHHQ